MSSSPCKRHWLLSALQLHCQLFILFVTSLTLVSVLSVAAVICHHVYPVAVYSAPWNPDLSSQVGKIQRCLVRPDTLELTDQSKDETGLSVGDIVQAEPLDKVLQQVRRLMFLKEQLKDALVSHYPIVALIRHSTVDKWTDFLGQASTGAVWSFSPFLPSWMCRIWPLSI